MNIPLEGVTTKPARIEQLPNAVLPEHWKLTFEVVKDGQVWRTSAVIHKVFYERFLKSQQHLVIAYLSDMLEGLYKSSPAAQGWEAQAIDESREKLTGAPNPDLHHAVKTIIDKLGKGDL